MAYLLDTNILVNAKRTYFGFDICPDFWGWLLHENNQGKIFSIDEVHEEIVNPKDRSNNPYPILTRVTMTICHNGQRVKGNLCF